MRLLVVSHTPHYRRDGKPVGWGPTLREIDQLATVFDEVVHVAPLHDEPAPESSIPYQSDRVRLVEVPASGGERWLDKLGILRAAPAYVTTVLREIRRADVVHVRCPAHISLMTVVMLALVRQPEKRWIKYAGNWQPTGQEPWSYDFQRWWLASGLHRGVVTVNGRWPDQPEHIVSFLNPCLTPDELAEGRNAAASKLIAQPIRMLFVGRLEAEKGVGRAIEIVERCAARGIATQLDLVGDGNERQLFEARIARSPARDAIVLHGWQARGALGPLYARAHVILHPSSTSEGWPKVLSEGMAYGAVPLAGAVSSIPQYLERFGVGRAFAPDDLDAFVATLSTYASDPAMWRAESQRAIDAASRFGYEAYLHAVRDLLTDGTAQWG